MSAGGGVPQVKLDDLYQEVILDHNRKPRNFSRLERPTHQAHGFNPLCGDDLELFLEVEGGTIRRIGFQGQGCAISKASASLLTTAVEGKSAREAAAIKDHFIELLTAPEASDRARAGVGRLSFFEGVKRFPIRVKCATLAWRTLEAALQGQGAAPVSTEDETPDPGTH